VITRNYAAEREAPIPAPREDLCLAYANTRFWRGTAAPTETLGGPDDLLRWLTGSAGVPGEAIDAVTEWVREDSGNAAPLFDAAIALREAIARIFGALASGEPVPEVDFAALNHALAEAPSRRQLARRDGAYGWAAEKLTPSAPVLLAPVLWAAADLLTRIADRRVRRCANDKCLWLFVDQSKGGTRRWCDMNACGNRAKSHRHYIRSKRG
jgi:predicted RNA-binding Zn ribbon-like protein